MLPQFQQFFDGHEHKAFRWPGGNRAALMIHGFPGSPAEMQPMAMHLHENGWTVDVPLLPGFGGDIMTLDQRTNADWLGTISAHYEALRRDHEQVIVIGNSMGAALSVQLAAQHEPDGLILLAPFWQIQHIAWKLLPVLKYFVRSFKPLRLMPVDFSDPNMREGIQRVMPDIDLDDPDVQSAMRNFSVPLKLIDQVRVTGQRGYAAIPGVRCPTLILQGRQDELVPPRVTRQMLRAFPGSVRYIEIDSEHNLIDPMSQAWKHVQHSLTDFIHLHSASA